MSVALLAGEVESIVGGDAVRLGTDADAVDGVTPSLVATPSSVDAIAALLDWASREGVLTVVRGGGTKQEWARPPSVVNLVLSLAMFNRIIDHAAGDLTVTVEGGAVLDEVNRTLAAHGQELALDPHFSDRATIGGILATNDSGPARHHAGTPADLVLGVSVVTANGLAANAGGRVVKNVAGYDLGRLVAGSHGELAVIMSATFKLTPLPRATASGVLSAESTEPLANAMVEMTRRQLEPSAVEIQADGGPSVPHRALVVRFGGDAAGVDAAVSELEAIARSTGALFQAMRDAAEGDLWRGHRQRPWLARTVARASWLPADLIGALAALDRLAPGVRWRLSGRAGVGSGHIGIDAGADQQQTAVEHLRSSPALGNVVIVKGPTALRAAVGTWPARPATAPSLTALKNAWDPEGILGAGRGPR